MGQQTSTVTRASDFDPTQARLTGADGGTPISTEIIFGQDDTGTDYKVFGATSGTYMLWDESADALKLIGDAQLHVGTVDPSDPPAAGDVEFDGVTTGSYMRWDKSADTLKLVNAKKTMTSTAITAASPSRQVYWQFTATGTLTGGMTGIEIRSTFNGAANATGQSITGAEIKARHTTGNTKTINQLRGVVGNADTKNGTTTTAYGVEGSVDVSAGGTITTAAMFHGNLNNSGTITNAYGIHLHGTSGVRLPYGIYLEHLDKTLYSSISTTGTGSAMYQSYTSSATSGNIYGARLFTSGTGASTGMVRGIRCEADMGASAQASLLEAGLFTAKVSSGSATVTNIRALSGHVSIGSSLTVSGDVVCVNAHMQTRSDESVTGVHAPLYIKNEAVGGTGLTLDAAVYITEASLSGGEKGYVALIDASTATMDTHTTDQVALMKFKNSAGTVVTMSYDTSDGALAFA